MPWKHKPTKLSYILKSWKFKPLKTTTLTVYIIICIRYAACTSCAILVVLNVPALPYVSGIAYVPAVPYILAVLYLPAVPFMQSVVTTYN